MRSWSLPQAPDGETVLLNPCFFGNKSFLWSVYGLRATHLLCEFVLQGSSVGRRHRDPKTSLCLGKEVLMKISIMASIKGCVNRRSKQDEAACMEGNCYTVRLCSCTGVCGEVLRRGRGCPVPGGVGSAAAAPQPRAGPVTGNVVKKGQERSEGGLKTNEKQSCEP